MSTQIKYLVLLIFLWSSGVFAQTPVSYEFGERFNDRHKYSNLVAMEEDGAGGYLLVRTYYGGLVLKPKGYIIEQYNSNLELISEYNYKFRDMDFVKAFFHNGQLNLLFLDYNIEQQAYEYWVHTSSIINYDFRTRKLLSLSSKQVDNPIGKNYYNRNFSNGFTTAILFDEDKRGFIISTHHKRKKVNKHSIHLFDAALNKRWEHDFSAEVEEKNYAFENVTFSTDMETAYIIGKAYLKKKRFTKEERRFAYELIKVDGHESRQQKFDEPGKFPEALYPIFDKDQLLCVGFYADRKDDRYNGIAHFSVNPETLTVNSKKFNPFSKQFMTDKFGRNNERIIRNLVFKGVTIGANHEVLFNAEEYFVTEGLEQSGSGQRVLAKRFHYNDIISVKLDATGAMDWARNINKSEVTQGDGAYASYSSFHMGGTSYFFICTASKQPQLINKERLIFKQGAGRNRNVFMISLDENGEMSYEKVIGNKEARLPLMVSKPLKNLEENKMLFYAKKGSKKQLVKVAFK